MRRPTGGTSAAVSIVHAAHVALTGNIASGKSTVAELFRRWGATVIDADQLVREVQAPGTPEFQAIVAAFGPEVARAGRRASTARALRASCSPIRTAPAEAGRRSSIPRSRSAARARKLEARRRGRRIVVNDIPLLFEALDPAAFDAVVLVDAPEALRLARLVAERGLPEAEARQLMAAQWPAEPKRAWRDPAGEAPSSSTTMGTLPLLERSAPERCGTSWPRRQGPSRGRL